MLYRYDKHMLGFHEVKWPQKALIGAGLIVLSTFVLMFFNWTIRLDKKHVEQQVKLIITQQNEFSQEKLIQRIKEMNFQFPYIVYAQAILETNHFSSRLFIENQNLFGMKFPTQRINLSSGIQNGYAYYKTWMDSLYDYGMYYSNYLSKILTEDEYYSYLSQFYAEDGNYIIKLKEIIHSQNLKSKFN